MDITYSQAHELLKDINTEEELRGLIRKLDVSTESWSQFFIAGWPPTASGLLKLSAR
jgi:hypothetical protein